MSETGTQASGLEDVSPGYLRRNARQAVREIRWVLKKHGAKLLPEFRSKLETLEQRLKAALEAANHEALGAAYVEAAECLENEAAPFRKGIVREYLEVFLIAGFLALISRTFLIQAFKIPSGSMIPTLLVGDYLIVSKLSYGLKKFNEGWVTMWNEPSRGDVLVFITPQDKNEGYFSQRDFIKRVIAVGGEKVEVRNRKIYVNGQEIADPWGHYVYDEMYDRDFGPVTVPKGSLFVMGDNRQDSQDSRVWGFVPLDLVVGKARFIYFSVGEGPLGIRWGRIGQGIE